MRQFQIINNRSLDRFFAFGFKATLFFIILLFISLNQASAQQAIVTLDRDQILIGEQVTLQLKVENLTDNAQQVDRWFKVEDTAGHIEVIRSGKIDTISIDGQTTLMQKLTLTSFDSGRWQIPVIEPVVKDINQQEYSLPADLPSVEVIPVDVSKMKDFHPVKDILAVDYTDYTWIYIVAGILVLGLIIWLIFWWVRKNKNRPKSSRPIVKGPPLAWAMGQIDQLEKEGLVEAGKYKEFYTRLLDICRAYFDERLSSHTFQATSKEMVDSLQAYLIRQQERADLASLASMSDYVKFAEHSPEVDQTKVAVSTAKQTLSSIEKQLLETQTKK